MSNPAQLVLGLAILVGLGALARVDEVLVRWVDGREEAYGPFETGREWRLARGAGRAR